MAQLPRCVQLASLKQVCGRAGVATSGSCGSNLSIRGMYSLAGRKAAAAAAAAANAPLRARAARFQYQHSLVFGVSSSSASRLQADLAHSAHGIGRGDLVGFYGSIAAGFRRDCSRVLKSEVRILAPSFARHLSSAEASAVADGLLREQQEKDAAETSSFLGGEAERDVPEEEVKGSVAVSTEIPAEGDGVQAVTEIATDVEGGKSSTVNLTEAEGNGGGRSELFAGMHENSVAASEGFLDLEQERDRGRPERDALIANLELKKLEMQEIIEALRSLDRKQSLIAELVDGDALSPVKPGVAEVEDSDEEYAAARLSPAIQVTDSEDDADDIAVLSERSLGLESPLPSESEPEKSFVLDSPLPSESESNEHPWPPWTQFLRQLGDSGYFDIDEDEIDPDGPPIDDVGLIKRACLKFSRERDDIFLNLPRKDLEVVARFGCPSTDRKVVNAGKRLRHFLAIDEISVCRPCSLRASCERRDFKASASHLAGTPEVIRLLSQYALEVSPSAKEGLQIPSLVQQSCSNLLKETIASSALPRDPSLPKPDGPPAPESAKRSLPRVKEGKKRSRDFDDTKRSRDSEDTELKKGDWKCEECQYVNFARNRKCRECNAFRPVPEMRPGDWRCPECQFVNFSRNEVCYDCKAKRPAGAGFESSFDRGSRYQRGAPQERGSRSDRGSSIDRRSSARDYDRTPYRRSETSNYERSSSRNVDRDMDRSERRGDRQREPMGRGSRDRGDLDSRFGNDKAHAVGRRPKYEEWKPDLNRKGKFDDQDRKNRRSAGIDESDDDADDDFDLSDNDDGEDDLSDVEGFDDEELEDMRPAARNSRGRGGSRSGSFDRGDKKDVWWEDDRSSRGDSNRGRGRSRDSSSSRTYDKSDRESNRSYGKSSGGRGGGAGRGGGRNGSRGGRGGRGRGR